METEQPTSPPADEAKQNALRDYHRILLQHKEADAKVSPNYARWCAQPKDPLLLIIER